MQRVRQKNMNNDSDSIHEIAEKEAGAEETREFRIFGPP
jgi:hypothetical protein